MSLESRDPADLLVSVEPPDLLDPLDCLVPLERLVVRYTTWILYNMNSSLSRILSLTMLKL